MKKITLLTAVVFTAIISHAQITKGSTSVGGHVSGSSNERTDKYAESKNTSWLVGVDVGHFIANNKAVGLFFNYGNHLTKSKSLNTPFPSSNKGETKTFGGGLFYRQYFPLSSKWYLFGEAELGYAKSNYETETNEKLSEKSKAWTTSLSITPGISFAAGKRLHIESSFSNLLSFAYGKSKIHYYDANGILTSTTDTKNFNGNANLSGFNTIQFGLRWILPGKKK